MLFTAILFSTLATILASGALVASVKSLIEIEAFKRSTHKLTFLDPTKQDFERVSEATQDKLKDDFQEFKNIM